MTKIQWDQVGERIYETGLDRGVLYLEDGTGVPWNGLVNVAFATGETTDPFYFDGEKYADYQIPGLFAGKLEAITYPDEFAEYDGTLAIAPGFEVGGQTRKPFGLSYRTLLGNDILDLNFGYKIHLVYNLTATADNVKHETVDTNVDPIEFSWTITAMHEELEGFAPTAHVILDSREMNEFVLENIEDVLYGTEIADPQLPPLSDLALMNNIITIVDHGDGTWSATGPDALITMLDAETFQITEADATYLDPDTYEISSSYSS